MATLNYGEFKQVLPEARLIVKRQVRMKNDSCYRDDEGVSYQDFFLVPIRWSENCYGISYFLRNGDCCTTWGRYSTPEAAMAAGRRFIDLLMSRCSNVGKYEE